MSTARLILIEGVPGSGKSTTAQFVVSQLRSQGLPVRWYHEELPRHPVRTYYEPDRHVSADDYCEDALARWSSFADLLRRGDETAVLDGALLQNHFRSLLYFDVERDSILTVGRRIVGVLSDLNPALIYLRPNNISRTIERACEVRGQRMLDLWLKNHDQFPYAQRPGGSGSAGFFAFWEEFGQLAGQLFADVTIRKLVVELREDWVSADEQVCTFLNLPSPQAPPPLGNLQPFAGTYVPLAMSRGQRFVLRAERACLIASIDAPTIDINKGPFGCFKETRLIPIDHNSYLVAGWPYLAIFEQSETGTVVSMRLQATESGWPQFDEFHVRREMT